MCVHLTCCLYDKHVSLFLYHGLCMYNSGTRQLLYRLHVSINLGVGRMFLPSCLCMELCVLSMLLNPISGCKQCP